MVEPLREVAGELEVLALVLADRHEVRAVEQDVGGLEDRVGEQPDATRRPPRALADLSLNWVIRRASPKPVRHCSTQPSWACAGIWLWTKIAERSGSMPIASSWAAARRVRSRSTFGSCSTVIACRSAMKKNGW